MLQLTPSDLSPYIDHTLLKPEARPEDIRALCLEARQYGFASVCVNSGYVPLAKKYLQDSTVKVCSVVGFPLGAMASKIKQEETAWAVANGATEIDMVIAVGRLKAQELDTVHEDIASVYRSCGSAASLKVILETSLLSDEEKLTACMICKEIGVAFVKTSTGFAGGGATVEDVALMRAAVGETIKVKAAGGIRGFADACALIEAGASRLGTSSGVALVQGAKESDGY